MNKKTLIVISLWLCIALYSGYALAAFVPHQGDYFSYYETIDVGNGKGDYAGYTDQTIVSGTENINEVTADGIASTHYSYTWDFSSNDGSTDSGSSSGDFTFSSITFRYINGTDGLTGYVNPTVWFCIDPSIPEGGTFYLLDTLMTVKSTEYSYYLPSEDRNVYAIFAQGNSNYWRDDEYGQFTATYTWNAYFDPNSGYIIGYDYTEQNTDSYGTGFTYTEKLYITSASYALNTAPPPTPIPNIFSGLSAYITIIAIALIIVAISLIAYAASRNKRRLPRHPTQRPVYTPPSEQPPPQDINLTPKQAPVQQIVIKEVVKVNCRYCGTLIDSTLEKCPYCGAPRR